MLYVCLPPFLLAAVVCDLYERRIPNEIITGGLIMGGAYQWSTQGPSGMAAFLQGVFIPLLMLGALHYFRMIGAGDIKLLMMAGGFFGAHGSLMCMFCAFMAGGLYALPVLCRRGMLARRMRCLLRYISDYRGNGEWKPYIERGEDGAFLHFSIPVLLGSLPVMGGFL